MAKVVWVPGVDPVNDGERRVIDAFADRLAPSVQIFPNVQIRLSPYQLVECDQLILTEDRLWVIEVKDLYGDVAFLKGQHIVDGDDRVLEFMLNALRLRDGFCIDDFRIISASGSMPTAHKNSRNVIGYMNNDVIRPTPNEGMEEIANSRSDPAATKCRSGIFS